MMEQMKSVAARGSSNYDVVVVGAAYPGLITGAIMCRNGLRTVVVDELDQIGGRFDGKVNGLVVRDKAQVVQELHAPVVVFTYPFWEVFNVINEKRFPGDVVKNAREVKKWYTRGDFAGLNIGVSRAPTVRDTGRPEDYMGWTLLRWRNDRGSGSVPRY